MSQSSTGQFCGRCGTALQPGATFCGHCGAAVAISAPATPPPSNAYPSSAAPPVSAYTPPGAFAYAGGYGPASQAQIQAALPRKSNHVLPWLIIGGVVLIAIIALGIVAYFLTASPTPPCRETCGPSTAPPLSAQHRFTSTAFGYSLDWYESPVNKINQTHADDRSISFALDADPTFQWQFNAEPANGRTEQQIVQDLAGSKLPGAQLVFTIPQAEIGYHSGFGNVYDLRAVPGSGQQIHLRGFIIVAIQNGIAVELVSYGPFRNTGWSHANPAESAVPLLFIESMNSVTWKGEPPR